MNVKILIAYHKESLLIKDDVFCPIQVGRAVSNTKLDMIGDNTGENISEKNPIYCEMSAVYWAWKNLDADYIGLCHYRRIFTFYKNSYMIRVGRKIKYYLSKLVNIVKPGSIYLYTGLIKVYKRQDYITISENFSSNLVSILQNTRYDAILPRPIKLSTINVYHFFEVGLEHMLLLDQIIKENHPQFYYYYKKSLRSNTLYAANIFIMKKHIFDDYCKTIFSILEEHEKRTIDSGWCIDIIKEKCYSRRSGYFAEILTNAYVTKLIDEGTEILYANTAFLIDK